MNNSEEIMICPSTMFRFRGSKSISINPPSNILHVSNLKLEICREDKITKIFGQYGNIDSIKYYLYHIIIKKITEFSYF